jgi:hypothetical protein
MAVIVWVWAFPTMVLPLLTHTVRLSIGEWATAAWHENGSARIYLVNVVMFSFMLIALIVPVRGLLRAGKTE